MGAFAAFALMTVAIGTDYWLYARAFICNSTANSSQEDSNNKDKKDPGALTHSGLWRICCLEGTAGPISTLSFMQVGVCWGLRVCVCVCVRVCVFVMRWSLEGLVEVSVLVTVIRTDINRCSLTHKHKPVADWSTFVYLSLLLICSVASQALMRSVITCRPVIGQVQAADATISSCQQWEHHQHQEHWSQPCLVQIMVYTVTTLQRQTISLPGLWLESTFHTWVTGRRFNSPKVLKSVQ